MRKGRDCDKTNNVWPANIDVRGQNRSDVVPGSLPAMKRNPNQFCRKTTDFSNKWLSKSFYYFVLRSHLKFEIFVKVVIS